MEFWSPPDGVIEMVIYAWEMTAETDERGYFGRIKDHLVNFRFTGVRDLEFHQFSIPNTLFEMTFSSPSEFQTSGRFMVDLVSVMGGDCFMKCSAIAGEVLSVKPCDKEGNPV